MKNRGAPHKKKQIQNAAFIHEYGMIEFWVILNPFKNT